MADRIDFTKTLTSGVKAVGNELLRSTGLGAFTDSMKKALRLGNNIRGGGNKVLPKFDVKFDGEKDFRAKIIVPTEYLENYPFTKGKSNELAWIGGVIFPYTPVISQDYSANYNSFNPTHSNNSLYFYKNSTPGPISVSGKFTVQNESDAYVWIATVHLLRTLTKMKFGGDNDAGLPPPVCRFSAYGSMQYNKVPVVISSVKVELPDSVDYYATGNSSNAQFNFDTAQADNGSIMVPTISTISVVLMPMYSREELLGLSHVDGNIGASPLNRQKGYL